MRAREKAVSIVRSLIALLVSLACVAGLSSLGDVERPGVPEVPDDPLAATADATDQAPADEATGSDETVVLFQSDDYTLFTDAIEAVIDDNGEAVRSAYESIDASQALAALQQAGASNDAAAASSYASAPTSSAGGGADTIAMGGQVIPYVGSHLSSTAPASTAGLWNGSDSTTDGSWGYFIGHNPGVFSCMLAMGAGSTVTVTDSNGAARTYTVVKVFDVPNTTTWNDISNAVTGYGESIVLQTCINDGNSYRIMVAA